LKTSLLASISLKVIREVAAVKPGENILILTDPLVSERIPASLAEAAHLFGGIPSLLVIPPSLYPGAPLPLPAEQAVKGAEVVIMATSKSVAHAEVFSREKNHRRLISMPGILEESFIEGGAPWI
jgi:hypothetical protein